MVAPIAKLLIPPEKAAQLLLFKLLKLLLVELDWLLLAPPADCSIVALSYMLGSCWC